MAGPVTDLWSVRAHWSDGDVRHFLRSILKGAPELPMPTGSGSATATDAMPRDARPERIPTFDLATSWNSIAQPDPGELDESSYISSLYEGCPYPVGQQREATYRRQKEAAQMIGGRRA